ncbi:MAG: hypothetical protein IJU37_13195 [Desulfovibrio sp.]|nr:hypothetical protein [Desulfovibrio sp.]
MLTDDLEHTRDADQNLFSQNRANFAAYTTAFARNQPASQHKLEIFGAKAYKESIAKLIKTTYAKKYFGQPM